jgi:hypothetical protein
MFALCIGASCGWANALMYVAEAIPGGAVGRGPKLTGFILDATW